MSTCLRVTGITARGSVERRGQSQYEVSYQPTIKGRHQLHIKVMGEHIRASPFSVAVKKSPVEKLGTPILTLGGLIEPIGVAVSQSGEVVVIDWIGECVSVFSASGHKLRSFGTYGSGHGQFKSPHGVAVDGEGNILVADYDNDRTQKFTAEGQLLTTMGTDGCYMIAFNSSNNLVYISDHKNDCIRILNSDLTFSSIFGKYGKGDGEFDVPYGIACDSNGNVYVADSKNHRIQVFTSTGKFLRMFGSCGEGRGELNCPAGIALDDEDTVYVSEQGNNRVSVFTFEGHHSVKGGMAQENLCILEV